MYKPKTRMPKDIKNKCRAVIHSSTGAATVVGFVPIPMSDTIPITAAQIGMIISLGKIFGVTLSDAAAKAIANVAITQQVGRASFVNIMKVFPGTVVVGSIIGGVTAAALTETLGWLVADDFYRMACGEEPENIIEIVQNFKDLFEGFRKPDIKRTGNNNTPGKGVRTRFWSKK